MRIFSIIAKSAMETLMAVTGVPDPKPNKE